MAAEDKACGMLDGQREALGGPRLVAGVSGPAASPAAEINPNYVRIVCWSLQDNEIWLVCHPKSTSS